MNISINTPIALLAGVLALSSHSLYAKVPKSEAKQLGSTLTPIGAVKAGNEEGNIPEWTGGILKPPRKWKKGKHHIDPYRKDKPLYTITKKNIAKYATQLTRGQQELFRYYPNTFKMHVYPSRRSASYPKSLYKHTKRNATKVKLTKDKNYFSKTARGYPFPIPKEGAEVMLNHSFRYAGGIGVESKTASAVVSRHGDYALSKSITHLLFYYNNPKYKSTKKLKNRYLDIINFTTEPAKDSGLGVMVKLPFNRIKRKPTVYRYERNGRMRTINLVGYDEGTVNQGLTTYDQIDMFNGPMDRYNFSILGSREVLIPYNSYQMSSPKVKYKRLIKKGHLNPDVIRYETHRVWVVEAKVKKTVRHTYVRRVFYIDEDSWTIVAQDIYDRTGAYWRYAEMYLKNFYEIPATLATAQIHYDMFSNRYWVGGLTNEEKPANYFKKYRERHFTKRNFQTLVNLGE